ncbi:Imm30 family immunity protein [Zobellia nedashkovskayae]|uniref:Imm30 family immunity protein n=1 Tax=Zobellia laminariae TaxID=248906 RepID=UPI0026F471EE|nr:Imm30 family immunity protein [Zobellia laminariae]WKX76175.1 Imm30 family immunity protein [Zobellia laminariae]
MGNLVELERQLIENRSMKTYEETGLYEEAVDGLFDEKNPDCILSLIKGFKDETENHEVMFSNLHGIEYFSKTIGLEKYIKMIIPLLKGLQVDAYDWSETIYLRLLNNEKSFSLLSESLRTFDSQDKEVIKLITENLIKRNPERFKEKGEIILSAL